MGTALERKGGAVTDGLHPGDRTLSLQECLSLGTLAQLGPLHGPRLTAKCLPDVAQEVFRGKEEVANEATDEANMGRQTFHGPTEGRPKSATARGKTKRLDIG